MSSFISNITANISRINDLLSASSRSGVPGLSVTPLSLAAKMGRVAPPYSLPGRQTAARSMLHYPGQ